MRGPWWQDPQTYAPTNFGPGAADAFGTAEKADLLQVRWPDGTTDEWKDVKADQVLRVEQGRK